MGATLHCHLVVAQFFCFQQVTGGLLQAARKLAGDDEEESTTEPLCYLLQVDQTNVLLDCGWDDRFDQTEYVKELEKIAPTLDCVLISHCTQRHVGAVPLLFSERVKCNPNCKIYASIPTHKLGQMLCYDIALGYSEFRGEFGEDVGYSLDDVDLAFSKFVPVKYQQHSRVSVRRESAGGDGGEGSAGNNNNSNSASSTIAISSSKLSTPVTR